MSDARYGFAIHGRTPSHEGYDGICRFSLANVTPGYELASTPVFPQRCFIMGPAQGERRVVLKEIPVINFNGSHRMLRGVVSVSIRRWGTLLP